MQKFPIVSSSDKAQAVASAALDLNLNELEVGFSLQVPLDYANEQRIRTYVFRQSNKLGFKLRVIKHVDLGVYEVARIA